MAVAKRDVAVIFFLPGARDWVNQKGEQMVMFCGVFSSHTWPPKEIVYLFRKTERKSIRFQGDFFFDL